MLQTNNQFRKIITSQNEQTDTIQVKPVIVRLKDMRSSSIRLSFFNASNKLIDVLFINENRITNT